MLESVSANGHSFDFCKEELKKSEYSSPVSDICIADLTLLASTVDITLDAGFKDFHRYCKEHDIPIVIISRYAEAPLRSPTHLLPSPSGLSSSFSSPPRPRRVSVECPWS